MRPERWEQIKEIFDAVVEQEPHRRNSFLDEACGQDSALRAEVNSLISEHEQAGSFLASPPLDSAACLLNQAYDNTIRSMELSAGRRLGSYEIIEPLGAGGMGEVYRASDTRLGRDVAIKILPEAFAHNPERLGRFRREAQLLAALNHPNIAAIHGIEESERVRFLVLELAQGETLAERLCASSLSEEDALRICCQVAEALEAAHEKGIIHRDLKPSNIKVTPEGTVKVLDFGLARTDSDVRSGLEVSPSSVPGSVEGIVRGTPAYMSPEQARGKPVDKRTDIWSFGCMLYELLTHRRAFAGQTVSDTIAAVLHHEPDWQSLPPSTPRQVKELLARCLQKDANHRLHDIADARIQIEEALNAPMVGSLTQAPSRAGKSWPAALLWALFCSIACAITAVAVWNLKRPPTQTRGPIARLVMELGPNEQLRGVGIPVLALSPDGTRLVYSASRGDTQQLYLRAMDQLEGVPIPGTEFGYGPFFSPDGEWVGFVSGARLKKVSTSGGAPSILCDAPNPRGASWGDNGPIVFAPTGFSGLSLISADGGAPQAVTTLDSVKDEGSHRWPDFLPGGKAVLFTVGRGGHVWDNAQIVVQSLETGERRVLVQGGTHARYVPTGHLIYARRGTLFAVSFDPDRLRVTGSPVQIAQSVMQSANGAAQFSFSRLGWLVYVPGSIERTERRLVWVDRKGVAQVLAAPPRAYAQPSLSPDARQLAVTIEGANNDVWLYDIPRDALTRLTFEAKQLIFSLDARWTADSLSIQQGRTT